MAETIQLGEIAVALTHKDVKHVHLSVHPPSGRVTLVAPHGTRSEVARAYAISRLGWIRDQQAKMRGQARETPRDTPQHGRLLEELAAQLDDSRTGARALGHGISPARSSNP